MLALVVVEAEPGANTSLGLGNGRIGVEVHLLVFEASPQSLHEDVVHAAALAVHADRYAVALQRAGEVVTGELAALVSIENLGSTIPGERLLERLDTSLSTQRVRDGLGWPATPSSGANRSRAGPDTADRSAP